MEMTRNNKPKSLIKKSLSNENEVIVLPLPGSVAEAASNDVELFFVHCFNTKFLIVDDVII